MEEKDIQTEHALLTETQIRAIIQDEFAKLLPIRVQPDRMIFEKNVQILDARNIQVGRTNGTMIGTGTDQKLGFFGATPVVRAGAVPAPSGTGTAGVDSSARNSITAIITVLQKLGFTN